MAASETGRRSIVQDCKYRPIARIIQHDEAKNIVGRCLRSDKADIGWLLEEAQRLRDKLADDDFGREVLDHNADYVERFAEVVPKLELPKAELLIPGKCPPLVLSGTKVTVEISFRMRRTTKTNEVRIGAGALRYAKGKTLPSATAEWQSAFLFGYLARDTEQQGAEPERALCFTADAYAGFCHAAPTDSVRRFKNMEAACATIAERWPNVPPPVGAKL